MDVGSFSPFEKSIWVCSVMDALLAETLVLAGKSVACLLMLTGTVLNDMNASLNLTAVDQRFPFDELLKREQPGPENKDGSDTEDDDEDEEDKVDDDDFLAEEGEEGDPEDDPEANGNGGSSDEDDDNEDDDDADDEEEEDEEDEDDEVPQPPSKKRK
ncbi:nucleolin-like [Hibiscus syriacus]|uniref:nucleolin-like n=1 Tax=Hibiscus syriacus TaxID=106335 RepID=UPI001923A382|nr:nucleolin-like [Hibiscus syriacus]